MFESCRLFRPFHCARGTKTRETRRIDMRLDYRLDVHFFVKSKTFGKRVWKHQRNEVCASKFIIRRAYVCVDRTLPPIRFGLLQSSPK